MMISNATPLFETKIVTEAGKKFTLVQLREGDPAMAINRTWWELSDEFGTNIICLYQGNLKAKFPPRISRDELNKNIIEYFTDYCNNN